MSNSGIEQTSHWLDKTIGESTRLSSLPARPGLLAALVLGAVLIVLAVHWPVLDAQALSFDDQQFLTENPLVQNPSWTSVRRFFSEVLEPTTVGGYYLPLSMVSLMLDTATGGSPTYLRPFHRTSLILHAVNTALIIFLIYQLFGRPWIAATVGLLFGAHPMTVEPVAWVGERKTLLAAFFAFIAMITYVRYCGLRIADCGMENPKSEIRNPKSRAWYIISVVCYIFSLMSKPTSTPLPLVLLLMDYWPLRRLSRRAVLEKVPFFVVAGISTLITLVSHARTAEVALPGDASILRVPLTICHLIVFYLGKILWPARLSSVYPLPEPLALSNGAVWMGIIGTAILIAVLVYSLRWTRAFLAGWLIFFLAISPTLGVIGYSWITASDKYVYLPAIGLLFMLAWYLERLFELPSEPATAKISRIHLSAYAVLMVIVGLETVGTRGYLRQWQTTERLAYHMAAMAPTSPEAQLFLGKYLCENGKLEEGIKRSRSALKLQPNYFKTHNNLGNALLMAGRLDEAIHHYRAAVQLKPTYANAQFNLAYTLAQRGKYGEAAVHYQQAIQHRTGFTKAHVNLALALSKLGRLKESIEQWQRAKELDPFEAYIRYQLGGDLLRNGRTAEGVKEFQEAIRLAPGDPEIYNQFAEALATIGEIDEAIAQCRRALQVQPDYAPVHSSLSALLLSKGDVAQALTHAQRAVQYGPNFAEGHINLGVILTKQGQTDRAIGEFREALRIDPRNINARVSLGITLQGQGKTDEAAEQFREVLKIDPLHAEAQRRLQAIAVSPTASAPT